MLIDWFTVFAQVVNFLVLVYLLKRFLYQPILQAIDERENRIATQLQEAAAQQAAADEQHQQFDRLNAALKQHKESLLAAAQSEAEAEQQRLLDEARQAYDELRTRLQDSLVKEQARLSVELRKQVQQETFSIARKTLADLANVPLEAQIMAVFIEKLQALGTSTIAQLSAALQSANHPLVVRSTFAISAEQQARIAQVVKSLINDKTTLEFQTGKEEVGGIELSANGYKIGWNITDYLDALEKRVAGVVENWQKNPAQVENINHDN